MLKRHRPSSPMPIAEAPFACEPDVDIDIIERVAKRRRHFAPTRSNSDGVWRKSSPSHAHGDDEDDGEEDMGHTEYSRPTRWQEEAGLYKAANTLLHDLHAEQRHRAIFSSTPSTAFVGGSANSQSHQTQSAWSSHAPKQTTPHHNEQSKHAVFSPPREPETDVEVQHVTQRYEYTNKLLGSLFLDRQRRLDAQRPN